jgi:MerR family transcriptional regulator, thiopeptide resistance regulator
MKTYTIGQVANKFSISRSTLIYYDSIGVLSPSERSSANYRLYSEKDISKMERISLFRKAGLPLESISSLLNHEETDLDLALENRLSNINSEIQSLRKQQKFILALLKNTDSAKNSRSITKEVWVALLEASGLDEEGMKKWHIEFERTSPEAHQDFLESIGIDADEISEIREWSRENKDKI